MAALFPTRRRAEAFARALEGEPTTDASLRALLETASRLAAVPVVEPRAEFRDALRARLLKAAAVELPAQAGADNTGTGAAPGRAVVTEDPAATRRRRRLVAAATGLVLVGGGTGVAAASEQALPGDMLYPIKRTIEAAEVSLAQGAGGEGRALLDRASTRLGEAQALVVQGTTSTLDVEAVEGALGDFSGDATAGGERLLVAFARNGDPSDVQTLRDFTADAHEALTDLAQLLPPDARPALVQADRTVVQLDQRAARVCPDCADAPLLQLLSGQDVRPDLASGASPSVQGRGPLAVNLTRKDLGDPPSGARQPEGDVTRAPRAEAGDGGSPLVPGVPLDGSAASAARADQNAAPGTGGGDRPRQHLDLEGLLAPSAPAPPPRETDGLDTRAPERVTGPLTGPPTNPLTGPPTNPLTGPPTNPLTDPSTGRLDPLLDDAHEGVEHGSRSGTDPLGDSLDGLL